jgi:hypothetical protein
LERHTIKYVVVGLSKHSSQQGTSWNGSTITVIQPKPIGAGGFPLMTKVMALLLT